MNKCTLCGSKMVKVSDSLFHYDDCGLPKIYLRGVLIHKCTNKKCADEEISIPNVEQLHQVLAEKLAKQMTKLAPKEVRFLRTHLGFSGVDFANALGVTPETVTRWEKGTVNMKETSERFLRVLILSKAGPFRNYEELKEFASKEKSSLQKQVFKITRSNWEFDEAA